MLHCGGPASGTLKRTRARQLWPRSIRSADQDRWDDSAWVEQVFVKSAGTPLWGPLLNFRIRVKCLLIFGRSSSCMVKLQLLFNTIVISTCFLKI